MPQAPDRLREQRSPDFHFGGAVEHGALDRTDRNPGFGALWAAALIISVCIAWFYSLRHLFFLQDDFLNFQIARGHPFPSFRLLGIPDIGRFSPFHRLVHWIHWTLWPMSWPAAVAIDVVLLAFAGVFFFRLLEAISGRRPFHLILLLLFVASPLWAGPLRWWAAAMHIVPGTAFGLMSLDGFVRYVQSGKRRFLVQSASGLALALSAYEKTLFLVPYAALFQILYLSRGTLRDRLRGFRAVWPAHVCLWGISGVYLAIVLARYYRGHPQGDPASLLKLIWLGWFETLAPSFIGLGPSRPPLLEPWGRLLGTALAFAWILGSFWRVPGAWRAWLLFAFGFSAAMIFVGFYRIQEMGLGLSREPRYVFEGSWLFLLSVGLAIGALPLNDRRPPLDLVLALPFVLGVLVFGPGTAREWINNWEGNRPREYFERFESSYRRWRGSEENPALLDSDVPAYVLYPWTSPYPRLSNVLTLFHPELLFSYDFGPGWTVDDRGDIRRASFERTSGVLPSESDAHLSARQGVLTFQGAHTCFARGPDGSARAEIAFPHAPSGQHLRIEHPNAGGWLKILTRDGTGAWTVLTENDDAEPIDRKKPVEVWRLRRSPGDTVSIEVISAVPVCLRIELGELRFPR